MTTPTTPEELRNLNRAIWLDVMGWVDYREEEYPYRAGYAKGDEAGEKCLECDTPDYCTDPAASMELLKKVGEIASVSIRQQVHTVDKKWLVWSGEHLDEFDTLAATLELSIALFAKKIFTYNARQKIEQPTSSKRKNDL